MGAELDSTLAAGSASQPAPDEQGPLLAGRYELVGMIGRGGMGCVYRVRDRELDEIVALKVLHRDLLAAEGTLERFRQEVRLARRVTHKNVARTFDIGVHGTDRFLTMELVEGHSLAARLQSGGALGVNEAVRISREMCDGMIAAHDAGVIHRDLKPDNVCIARDGRVVLMDFGIARVHMPDSPNATSGKMMGTPGYMAPEQVLASDRIDARADIYAFGAMLFEMVTGRPAWQGESAIVIAAARLWSAPPDPRSVCPTIPDALADLIVRCMAKEPDGRVPDARALAAALAALETSSDTRSRPPDPPRRGPLGETTVAVLRFRNLGADEDEYFVDGLTEDLIDALSTTRGLRIRGRAATQLDEGPQDAGRRLGVDVVIEGSIRRLGDTLRVSARVIGVQDGFQVWSGRFERPIASALGLNDEVARSIASSLSRERDVPTRETLRDPVALEHYFRARQQLARFWTARSSFQEALDMLGAALDRAPDDPAILAGYVAQHARFRFLTGARDPGLKVLARRALEQSPHLGEPWFALASVRYNVDDDAPGAMRALARAMLNAPSLPEAPDLAGRILLEADALEEAEVLIERALWLDPLQPWAHVDLMRLAALRGQFDRLEAVWTPPTTDEQGRTQRALTLQRLALWGRLTPPPSRQPMLPAGADARMQHIEAIGRRLLEGEGLSDSDRDFLARFTTEPPPRTRARRLYGQLAAEFFAYVHEDEAAIGYVRFAIDEGLRDLAWLDRNPLLAPYRRQTEWSAMRAHVEERASAVVAAWRGPPATLDEILAK